MNKTQIRSVSFNMYLISCFILIIIRFDNTKNIIINFAKLINKFIKSIILNNIKIIIILIII